MAISLACFSEASSVAKRAIFSASRKAVTSLRNYITYGDI
jgi:hypothetical protein